MRQSSSRNRSPNQIATLNIPPRHEQTLAHCFDQPPTGSLRRAHRAAHVAAWKQITSSAFFLRVLNPMIHASVSSPLTLDDENCPQPSIQHRIAKFSKVSSLLASQVHRDPSALLIIQG